MCIFIIPSYFCGSFYFFLSVSSPFQLLSNWTLVQSTANYDMIMTITEIEHFSMTGVILTFILLCRRETIL